MQKKKLRGNRKNVSYADKIERRKKEARRQGMPLDTPWPVLKSD